MTFGEKLEQACKHANILTQVDLARKADTTKASISRYMSGLQNPSRKALDALTSALGVEKDFFDECFTETDNSIEKLCSPVICEEMLLKLYRKADDTGKRIILQVAKMEADRQQESQENLT